MGTHTHDEVDWAQRLPVFQRSDRLRVAPHRETARRLGERIPAGARVLDIGCGAGGMSVAFAEVLSEHGGGALVLVDAVPEMLAEAERAVGEVAGDNVEVRTVLADAAGERLPELVSPGDLVWASRVLHHLPDQQAGVVRLAGMVRPGGVLAICEGGLRPSCLPWDLGVGEPGLETRLEAAREAWFRGLRAGIEGVVRMPYGWGTALANAELTDVEAFSVLTDHPAPASAEVREHVCENIKWISETATEWLGEQDLLAVRKLLDPADAAYLGARDDLFLLSADTVHCGRK